MRKSLTTLSLLFLSSISMAQSAFTEMKKEDLKLHNYREYGHLVPDRFRFANQKEAQRITDGVTLRIFDSERARKALCFAASESNSDISYFLGVSEDAAQKISSKCQGHRLSDSDQKLFQLMKSQFMGGSKNQKPKRYVYFYAIDSFPAIEGFTARDGLTLIMLNEKEVSEGRLIRVIAHEIAMSFDRLGRLSPEFSTQNWDEGLSAVFGASQVLRSVFEDVKDPKALRCALGDPAIRYGAATERAFRFEDQIIKDLNQDFGQESKSLALNESCERIIGKRAVQISPLVDAVMSEATSNLYRDECGGFDLLKDARRVQTLVGRIKTIAATELKMKKDGRSVNLCSILLNPQVGPRQPENMRHGGPRPRGSGW